MANYKLKKAEPPSGGVSYMGFQASATNTVVTSVTGTDSSSNTTIEVLVKKGDSAGIIELGLAKTTTDTNTFELLTAPIAMEANDQLYFRTSRVGAKFIISYVEETTVANGTALGGLADVDTTGASDGQSLVYDSSNGEWVPQTITGGGGGGGASALDDLSDVAITGGTSGHILRSNGTNFVNVSPTTDIIPEGSTNEYYTDAKVDARIAADTTKADASHTHIHSEITDFDTATNALIAAHPDLGEANVNADWNATSGDAEILNKPALFSGSYTDLTNVPATFAPSSHTHTLSDITDSGTAAALDVAAAGDAAAGEVVKGDDTRLADSRTPTAHTHSASEITDFDTEVSNNTTVTNNGALGLAALGAANTASQDLNAHVSSIENHSDVSFSYSDLNRPNNAFIVWDDVSGRWEDGTVSIDKCSDVDTSTSGPSVGDVLKWDGSNWSPGTDNTSGGGGGSDSFNTITVSGQTDVVADSGNDTLELAEGTGIDITTDATNDKVTFALNASIIDLNDVGAALPSDGEFLRHDGSEWLNDNISQSDVVGLTTSLTDLSRNIGETTEITSASGLVGTVGTGCKYLSGFASGQSLSAGKVYYLSSSGWAIADNRTNTEASGLLAMCTIDSTTGGKMLQSGAINAHGSQSGYSVGKPVYLSANGEITDAATTTATEFVRVIGYYLEASDDTIFFNPSNDWIEIS